MGRIYVIQESQFRDPPKKTGYCGRRPAKLRIEELVEDTKWVAAETWISVRNTRGGFAKEN